MCLTLPDTCRWSFWRNQLRQPCKRVLFFCQILIVELLPYDEGYCIFFARTCLAASCSASPLLFPIPVPQALPLMMTSITKFLLWSGPDSSATLYFGAGRPFDCTI